jgi:hypothetical protein
MPKHLGPNKSRRPSFDSLEERSLLSGVIGWSAGPTEFPASPAGSSPHSGPGWLAGPAAGGSPMNQERWPSDPDSFGPAQQPDGGPPAGWPGGFAPSQGPGGPTFGPDADAQSQAGDESSSPANAQSSASLSSQPNVASTPFVTLAAGFAGLAAPRSQPVSNGGEPAGGGQSFSGVEGVAAGSNPIVTAVARESAIEPIGASPSPISQGVTPVAQTWLLDASSTGRGLGLAAGSDGTAGGSGGGGAGTWSAASARSERATPAQIADHSLFDRSTRLGEEGRDELPDPSRADLIAAGLPLDRAALDRAIDQFFHQLDGLGVGDRAGRRPARIVLISLFVTSSFLALEVVRRRWQRWSAAGLWRVHLEEGGGGLIGFPERPRSWSSRQK